MFASNAVGIQATKVVTSNKYSSLNTVNHIRFKVPRSHKHQNGQVFVGAKFIAKINRRKIEKQPGDLDLKVRETRRLAHDLRTQS